MNDTFVTKPKTSKDTLTLNDVSKYAIWFVCAVLSAFYGSEYLPNGQVKTPTEVCQPTTVEKMVVKNGVETIMKAEFSNDKILADLVIPSNPIEVYNLVKIKATDKGSHYDLMVMTIANSNILFIDAVETINGAEWVFTGPPGKYSIRLTTFHPDIGFRATTGNVVIGTVNPVPNPNPQPNPNPNPTPNPSPVPVGKYGFGPAMAEVLVKIDRQYWKYYPELADNFESVASAQAAGSFNTPDAMNKELQGKNRLTLKNDATIINSMLPFFQAWSDKASALNKEGKLPNVAAEYSIVYRETVEALRSVK